MRMRRRRMRMRRRRRCEARGTAGGSEEDVLKVIRNFLFFSLLAKLMWGVAGLLHLYRLMVCEIHIFVVILVVAIVELTFMTAKGGARILDYTFFLHLLRRVLPCFCPRYCWGLGGGCAESDPELPPFASDALHQTRWTLLLLLFLQLLLHHLLLLLASRQAILVRAIFVRSAICLARWR